jgi:hypothetical protein
MRMAVESPCRDGSDGSDGDERDGDGDPGQRANTSLSRLHSSPYFGRKLLGQRP